MTHLVPAGAHHSAENADPAAMLYYEGCARWPRCEHTRRHLRCRRTRWEAVARTRGRCCAVRSIYRAWRRRRCDLDAWSRSAHRRLTRPSRVSTDSCVSSLCSRGISTSADSVPRVQNATTRSRRATRRARASCASWSSRETATTTTGSTTPRSVRRAPAAACLRRARACAKDLSRKARRNRASGSRALARRPRSHLDAPPRHGSLGRRRRSARWPTGAARTGPAGSPRTASVRRSTRRAPRRSAA